MQPVDPNSQIPYYQQVITALRGSLRSGVWQAGDQLPSEAELCTLFQVSRTVIRHALTELAREGLFERKKGRGTFVAEAKVKESLVQKLTGFYQDMVEQGHTPTTHVLLAHVIPAENKVAAPLQIAPGTPVFEIKRLRSVAGEPIVLVTTYIPLALCPTLLETDLANLSLYAILEQNYGLTIMRGVRTIEAVQARPDEAELLQVEPHAPLVLLRSTSYLADETPLEYYHALHRGDRSRFEVELVRTREAGDLRDTLRDDRMNLPPSNRVVL